MAGLLGSRLCLARVGDGIERCHELLTTDGEFRACRAGHRWNAVAQQVSEGAGHTQTDRAPSDIPQSGPHAFGSPEVGYAMPAGGSTTWPESCA